MKTRPLPEFETLSASDRPVMCCRKRCVAAMLSGCVLALAGCYQQATRPVAMPWKVEPVMRIANADGYRQRSAAMYQLGRYYDGQMRMAAAEDAYRKSIALDPDNAEARNALGALLAGTGRFEDAIESLKAAVLLAPTRAHILNNLGYAYMLDGNYSKAVFWLNEAVRVAPDNQRAAYNLAMAQQGVDRQTPGPEDTKALAIVTTLEDGAEDPPALLAQPGSVVTREPTRAEGESGMELAASDAPDAGWNFRLDTVLRSVGNQVPEVATAAQAHAGLEAIRNYRLEISNGMGRHGMAHRLGAMLHQEGAPFAYLTDLRPFTQRQTEVEFAKGYQADATLLAQRIGANTVQVNTLYRDRRVHVRIRVGRDIDNLI